ncbi:MAG: hypothetical protein Q7T96_06500 [Methylobacter sp.]|nr:hypothetical protein [Methylobacter sp.]
MWKIAFGVAFGIVLAGIIATFGFIFFTSAAIWGFNEVADKRELPVLKFMKLNNSLPVVPIGTAPYQSHQPKLILPVPAPFQIPKTHEALVREKSQKAYTKVRKDVEDFKAQYKKPEECYDLKDSATRMHCANAFIQARETYEALNK